MRIEVWLASATAILAILTYVVPMMFGNLVWILTSMTGGDFGVASTVAQFAVSTVLIILPTSLLGATFPVAVKAASKDIEKRARDTG